MSGGLSAGNAQTCDLAQVPLLSGAEFRDLVLASVRNGARVASLFAWSPGEGKLEMFVVLADSGMGNLLLARSEVLGSYPALTPECPQVHWFEREMAEQWSLCPEGHPWLKPIRFQPSCVSSKTTRPAVTPDIGVTDFYQMAGEEIHEVAVGPVHAGIIEPGHFRFQCHGENVYHLEISLGYQHRGVERALLGPPAPRTIHYMETLAGDTSVGHATAYCQVMEALGHGRVSARAQVLRGIALELERLANHTGDLGAMAGDVGFLPTASYCGRIRGDFLNMTATLCGNRFGRNLVRPGGTAFDLNEELVKQLLERIEAARRDVSVAVDLLWNTPSVLGRFENTGPLLFEAGEEIGLVGVAARACGLERDIRHEFPTGIYRFAQMPITTTHTGDVFGRAFVRWLEIQRSLTFVQDQLRALPEGPCRMESGPPHPHQVVASLVEGWRGEICHVAITDGGGGFAGYKIVDPSFHNWMGLALALRGQQISDFPLCNKSFNLSYCGHDL